VVGRRNDRGVSPARIAPGGVLLLSGGNRSASSSILARNDPDSPIPFAPNLEDLYLPSPEKIIMAVREVIAAVRK